MKTGRPAGIRSRPLVAWGAEPSHAQADAVLDVIEQHTGKAAPDDVAAHIGELFENYTAATAARAARVGAAQEVADLAAIADDAEAVAEAGDVAPAALRARLRDRLHRFPPFAAPRLAAADPAAHHARLHRIRTALLHRVLPDPTDLRTLAAACRACPAPPRVTKPSRAPADELQRGLAALAEALPLLDPTATGRRAFVEELTAALGLDRASYRAR